MMRSVSTSRPRCHSDIAMRSITAVLQPFAILSLRAFRKKLPSPKRLSFSATLQGGAPLRTSVVPGPFQRKYLIPLWLKALDIKSVTLHLQRMLVRVSRTLDCRDYRRPTLVVGAQLIESAWVRWALEDGGENRRSDPKEIASMQG